MSPSLRREIGFARDVPWFSGGSSGQSYCKAPAPNAVSSFFLNQKSQKKRPAEPECVVCSQEAQVFTTVGKTSPTGLSPLASVAPNAL